MIHLEEMKVSELKSLPRDRTVFFIPVGPIEDHGDALPIGLDLFEATAVSEATGAMLEKEGWTAVLLPRACIGIDSNTSAIALRVRPHVLRDYLVDVSDSLAKSGFRYFIAISGNPGPKQLTAIEEAGLFLKKRYSRFGIFRNNLAPILVSGSSVAIDVEEKSKSALFMSPPEHGGGRDSSIGLATAKKLINEPLLATLAEIKGDSPSFSRWNKFRSGEVSGYWGDPKKSNSEEGLKRIEEKARSIAIKFRAGVEGGKPHQIFKSWYSLFPTNQSLFRIWILVLTLVTLLGGWTFYSLQGFLSGANLQ